MDAGLVVDRRGGGDIRKAGASPEEGRGMRGDKTETDAKGERPG